MTHSQTRIKLEFLIVSFFFKDFLKLKPIQLRNKRKEYFKTSITNPYIFAMFFNLSSVKNEDRYSDYIINSLFSDSVYQDGDFEDTETGNEVDFDLEGIFFKISKIEFEKNANIKIERIIRNSTKYFPSNDLKMHNFIHVDGLKLLFSNYLKDNLTNFFKEIMANLDSITKLKDSKLILDKSQTSETNFGVRNGLYSSIIKQENFSTKYLCGISISSPEFNIYDENTDTQVLFSSESKVFCLISRNNLEYDIFNQDPKYQFNILFRDLQLFTSYFISSLKH